MKTELWGVFLWRAGIKVFLTAIIYLGLTASSIISARSGLNNTYANTCKDFLIRQDNIQDTSSVIDLEKILRYISIKMARMQLSGNPDYDFALLMTEHIKGSINLSNIEIKEGKDSVLKKLASSIIVRKKAELIVLKTIIEKAEKEKRDNEEGLITGASGQNEDKGFFRNESNLPEVEITDNLDFDYATLMIRHHQSAIDLCSRFLEDAEMEETIKIARKIINQNGKEIKTMLKWKDKLRSED